MPGLPSYWSPNGVVSALRGYLEMQETLIAGLAVPPETGGGGGIWEPGPIMEKLACRKADLDLAIRRLTMQQARAVICYYINPGCQSYVIVGRILRITARSAQERVERGVVNVCCRLCGYNCRASALAAFYDRPKEAKSAAPAAPAAPPRKTSEPLPRIHPPSVARYIVDEHTLRSTTCLGAGDD